MTVMPLGVCIEERDLWIFMARGEPWLDVADLAFFVMFFGSVNACTCLGLCVCNHVYIHIYNWYYI